MLTVIAVNQEAKTNIEKEQVKRNIMKLVKLAKGTKMKLILSDSLLPDVAEYNSKNINYQLYPSKDEESVFLKHVLSDVSTDFLLIDLVEIEIFPYNFMKFLKQERPQKWATLSPSLVNTSYPAIQSMLIDKKSKKELKRELKSYLKESRRMGITLEITGNPYLCYFSYDMYRTLGFDWSLKASKQLIFEYFYRINDVGALNYVSRASSSFRYIPIDVDTIDFLEDVQVEQAVVLEKYTNGYLAYEPIFHQEHENGKKQNRLIGEKMAFRGYQRNKNILYIAPNDIFVNGLNSHLKDLITHIRDTHFYVLMPSFSFNDAKFFELVHYFNGIAIARMRVPYYDSMHISNVSSIEYQRLLENVITTYDIDVLHIHIMALGHTLDAPKIGKKLGIQVILSLHDLYYLSGDFTQRNTDRAYREDVLLEKYNIHYPEDFYEKWHTAVQKMFDHVDILVVFSRSTQDIYEKWYKLPSTIRVIPHGYHYSKKYTLGVQAQPQGKLRGVFFGRVEEEKGSKLLWDLVEKHKDIELHVLGTIADPRFKKWKLPSNLKVYGKYKKENLPQLLRKIKPHFVYLPSVWDETFAFTLTEAYLYGIYPLVSPKGALAERVLESGVGLIVDEQTLSGALDYVRTMDWQKNSEQMLDIKLVTVEEMITIYTEMYNMSGTEKIDANSFFEKLIQNDEELWIKILKNDIMSFIDLQEKLMSNTFVKNKVEKARSWKWLEKYRKFRKKALGVKKQ